MSIRSNKARAERLVATALAERRNRREHAARAKAIFLDRLGSPGGLAVCFGAGAVTGWRLRAAGPRTHEPDGDQPDEEEQESALERFADGPVGRIAVRLAAATIVRYLLRSAGGGGDAAGEPAEGMAGAEGP